jgi:hypothetical protein
MYLQYGNFVRYTVKVTAFIHNLEKKVRSKKRHSFDAMTLLGAYFWIYDHLKYGLF